MGFGYVLIGYLVTFVLYLTVAQLGFAPLALLAGYGLMYLGLRELAHYHRSFRIPAWMLLPLSLVALCDAYTGIAGALSTDLPAIPASVAGVLEWLTFALIIGFHVSLLAAIRNLSAEVGISRIGVSAVRNCVLVGLYAVLYLVAGLPFAQDEAVRPYFNLPLVLLQVVWIVCNLFLFLTCAKDICPEGEEDQKPKRYRWDLLNKIGDAYERNRQKAIDTTTKEAEEKLRKRQANRQKKKRK